MNDINIYLIRHGESTANVIPDMIGQAHDTELTDNGREQAAKLGNRFVRSHAGKGFNRPDFVASSTYKRAIDTAKIVAKEAEWIIGYDDDVKINLTDTLVEYNPGDWRGKSRSEVYKDIESLKGVMYLHMGFQFPNGESYHQVERRAVPFIEENIIYNKDILALAEKKEVNTVLFSHGQTIKAILHYVMGYDQSFLWKIRIGNTSISHLVYNEKGWFLNSINDMGHLTAR